MVGLKILYNKNDAELNRKGLMRHGGTENETNKDIPNTHPRINGDGV